MFDFLKKLESAKTNIASLDEIAMLLKTSPETLAQFEDAYRNMALDQSTESDSIFDMNSRDAAKVMHEGNKGDTSDLVASITKRAVDELVEQTNCLNISKQKITAHKLIAHPSSPLKNEDLRALPVSLRPQVTGNLMQVDTSGQSFVAVLEMYKKAQEDSDPKKQAQFYGMFRQGLDILDLDSVLYEMLSMNPNSMSQWLPAISEAAWKYGFFQIPETKIVKVPLTLLQLTRMEYGNLTRTTLDIVDQWAMKAFDLDVTKSYFIKTGTYSSKFDFRNAKVTSEKEVRELGEYLLFIHHQAIRMAGPLVSPCIYSVSTTNEWVVREYIEDKENNPCIYKGMPLHTEYRVFVDFDTDEVLGYTPYWRPDVMLKRFSQGAKNSQHDYHDYLIYKAHEETLMGRYNENVATVVEHVKEMISSVDLSGQWSLDIMQNGDDFWLIDMATADTSALNDCVPREKLKKHEENWLPDFSSRLPEHKENDL